MILPHYSKHAQPTAMSWRWLRRIAISLTAIGALTSGARAEKGNPLKPADTSSPQDTLKSFYEACNEAYKLAKEHRNTGGLNPE